MRRSTMRREECACIPLTPVSLRDFDVRDPEHATCRALLRRLAADTTQIIVPLLLLAEIAGTISRERRDPIAARLAVDAIRAQLHIRLIPLDDPLIQEAAELAADYTLRGADAVYVAVARRHRCILVSLDRQQRERPAAVITTRTPADALVELTPPASSDEQAS